MKWCVGWMITAVVCVVAATADAQVLAPYRVGGPAYVAASDVGGPYAVAPPDYGPRYVPSVLPPYEIYAVLRENGFSPLGAPQQRGLVYTISAIDRNGEDGRLVIDARTGRIIRFMPAFRMGGRINDEITTSYGAPGPLPEITDMRRASRPPDYVPRVASHTASAPLPNAAPPRAVAAPKPLAAKPAPAPAQKSAQAPSLPVEPKPAPQAATPQAVSPQIMPTQDMPKAQGLD